MHQIGEVAEPVGLSLRTIRHCGEVVRLIKYMKPLEFTLDEMRQPADARVPAGHR